MIGWAEWRFSRCDGDMDFGKVAKETPVSPHSVAYADYFALGEFAYGGVNDGVQRIVGRSWPVVAAGNPPPKELAGFTRVRAGAPNVAKGDAYDRELSRNKIVRA